MAKHVQNKIKYTFADESLLLLALSSAHRDRDDTTQHDGNRGLAHYGTVAIEMAKTHNTIVEHGRTLHDLNTQNHWSKSRRGRAMACRALGIEPFITRSVRQQHQPPSDTVLDNALSAILGAVWLDCERQNRTVSATRRTIWEVLETIDVVLENASLRARNNYNTVEKHHAPQIEAAESTLDGYLYDWFEQEFGEIHQELSCCDDLLPEPRGFQVEVPSTLSPRTGLAGGCTGCAIVPSTQQYSVCAKGILPLKEAPTRCMSHDNGCCDEAGPVLCSSESTDINRNAATPTVRAKRKRTPKSQDKTDSTYRSMLGSEQDKLNEFPQDERTRLIRFLELPVTSKSEKRLSMLFRFLYLAIGSWATIEDYKNQLRLARSVSGVGQLSSASRWSAAQTYDEICRLEKEEALSVLRRWYHAIKLCGNEPKSRLGYSQMIVRTPRTVGAAGGANAGNPILALDAKLTNELLRRIMPNMQEDSKEFEKARRKVKRLRRLARYLHVLVDSYGFGILALLPSGPSFGELSLTDNMLLSMNEASFNDFAEMLLREQGPLLHSLSKFVEPSLLALATYSLEGDTMYPIECIDLSCLCSIPKGLLNPSKCPLVEHDD